MTLFMVLSMGLKEERDKKNQKIWEKYSKIEIYWLFFSKTITVALKSKSEKVSLNTWASNLRLYILHWNLLEFCNLSKPFRWFMWWVIIFYSLSMSVDHPVCGHRNWRLKIWTNLHLVITFTKFGLGLAGCYYCLDYNWNHIDNSSPPCDNYLILWRGMNYVNVLLMSILDKL